MRPKLKTKTKRAEHCIPTALLEKRVRVSVGFRDVLAESINGSPKVSRANVSGGQLV
jgi:hypothetical protein